MNKCYYRIVWENYPSEKTPLNEHNLNRIDVAVDEMDNRIISLNSTKFDKSEAQLLVKYIEYDESNGIFKITHYNGASYTIDTLLEKLAINFDYDYQTQRLIIELSDGTIKYVDLSALITQYEFLDSDTVHFTISADGKVKADIKDGSIQEKHLRPDYLADIKVEVAKAEAAATAADASKTAAAGSASTANTKAGEAATSATNAANSATAAEASKIAAAASATTATNKANEAAASATNAANSKTAAATSETNAASSASTAANKANAASTSATSAAASAENADTYSKQAQSYAIGTGGVRPSEASDNAKYYYEQSKDIYDNFSSAGNVTGVKGNSETAYRAGNVNITKSNIGLGNVDNTSDSNKPISTAQQEEFNKKLATDGDGSNITETFTQPASLTNISTGENHATIFGKIAKAISDYISHKTTVASTSVLGHVKVDSSLSSTSTNPVQNKTVNSALSGKLAANGNGSNTTVYFSQAAVRENIVTGAKQTVLMGRIQKWFADMTAAAFAQIITSNTDLMATTVAGYLVDALAVKQQFDVVNSNLSRTVNGNGGYTPVVSFDGYLEVTTNEYGGSRIIFPQSYNSTGEYVIFVSTPFDKSKSVMINVKYNNYADIIIYNSDGSVASNTTCIIQYLAYGAVTK